MKNTKPQRDTLMQAQYREALTLESIQVYGAARCFASKKQYKGLIASHIKPYMLCVLEGDETAEFDPDNGLLLAKFIDDYFDKLLLTFDDDGCMIFCDSIPEEVKDEFQHYSLGSEVYNEKRKQYMKIHRSLFYYKNYMRHAEPMKKSVNLSIPYVDCGIRVYNGKAIICNDNRWELLPVFHLKAALAERAHTELKFDAYASGAEVFSALCQNEQYVLPCIPVGFNTPSRTVNEHNLSESLSENSFKICSSCFDLEDGFPETFYDFLVRTMRNESDIASFRKIIASALRGEKIEKYVILNGVKESVDLLLQILHEVLGSYVADIPSPKILLTGSPSERTIPNCRLLVCNMRHKYIAPHIMESIAKNLYFSPTVINIDRYVPIFCHSGKRPVDNSIVIDLKKGVLIPNLNRILEEGGKILNWFLAVQDTSIDYSSSILPISAEGGIKEWVDEFCEYTSNAKDKVSATELYNSYQTYMQRKNCLPVSMNRFSREMQKYANKKRAGAGIFYLGLKIKPREA